MGKKEICEGELAPLLQRYFENGDETRLLEYLTGRSNLPGPRANLELLGAFGDFFSKRCREKPASYWELAMKLAGMSRSVEGRDEPVEFGVLCGVVALASRRGRSPSIPRKGVVADGRVLAFSKMANARSGRHRTSADDSIRRGEDVARSGELGRG